MSLTLLLRVAGSTDTSEYLLHDGYDFASAQETVDTAIDRNQPLRLALANGNTVIAKLRNFRLIAVVDTDRLALNRHRFRL